MDLSFRIDDREHALLVRGEDRVFDVRILERFSIRPTSLLNANLTFKFPRQGGKVARSTLALTFTDANVSLSNSAIAVPGHGLVDGDFFLLSSTGTLPAPLDPSLTYYVIRVDADTIQLSLSNGGEPVVLTSASGGGTHSIPGIGISVVQPAQLGEFNVSLPSRVTSVLSVGAYQTAEIEFVIAGVTRIVELCRAISVIAKTVP